MKSRSWMLYAGMFLAASLSPLGSTMIAVALPSISHELGIPGGALTQWLVASYLIVGIAVMSPCGKLGDIIGHRRGLTIGMAIYGVGSSVGFVFATLPSLAFARIAMALGGAMTVPATMALLRNAVPEARRPRTFGYYGAVMGSAAAIGPLVGGELTARFGWRAVFVANIPVILLAFGLIALAGRAGDQSPAPPPPAAPAKRPRFDIEGSILLGAALTLFVVASRKKDAGAVWAALTGAVLMVAFVFWERRAAEPVLNLRLFLRREFAAGNAVVGLQNLAMYALLFQLPIFFEQIRGLKAGTTGRTIVGMMIAMVLFAPLGGRLAERFGARATVFVGCLTSLIGVCLIANFSRLHVPRDALGGLVLMGAGMGLATSPSQSVAMTSVDRSQAGMAGGVLSTARYLGGVVGISVLAVLLAANAGIDSHSRAGSIYIAALALSAVAALMLPRKERDPGISQ